MLATLEILNADEALLKALRSVVKLHPQSTLKIKKHNAAPTKYPKEFLKSLDEAQREFQEQKKNGTLKLYSSVEEAFKAEGII